MIGRMKQVLYTLVFLAACFLAACGDGETGGSDGERIAVVFRAGNIATTKVNGNGDQWSQYDSIGVFMLEHGGGMDDIVEVDAYGSYRQYNLKYRQYFAADSACFFFPDMIPMYFPAGGRKVDFIAYYLYNPTITDHIYPVDVSSEYQEKPGRLDLLYSNNAKGCTYPEGVILWEVDLIFTHALCKITFNLEAGEGAPDLTDARIKISDLYRKADFHLGDGQLYRLDSPGDIEVFEGMSSLILIPQDAPASALTVTLPNENNSTYTWDFPASTRFSEGFNYTYTIRVSKTGIEVFESGISDWNAAPDTEAKVGSYKIGDYYPDPNVDINDPAEVAKIQGIIVWLNPADSNHGKIAGLKSYELQWSIITEVTNATDRNNGRKNMKTIHDLGNWSNYPAFEMGHSLNDPAEDYSDPDKKFIWYLPAIQEALEFGRYIQNYGVNLLNSRITAVGGDGFAGIHYYWSSTERSGYDRHAFNWRYDRRSDWVQKTQFDMTRYIMEF